MSTSKGPLKQGKAGTLALEAGLDDAEIAGISGGVTHHHATPVHKAATPAASHEMPAHQAATDAALQQHDAAQATAHVDAMTPAAQGAIGVATPHQDAAQTVSHVEVMTPAAKGAIAAAFQQHDAVQAAPQIHEMTPAAQGAIAAAIKLNDAGHAGATFASALDPLVEASPQKGVLFSSLKDIHGTEVSGEGGKSASNFLGGAALDGALLQSYYKAPTDSAGAHTEKDNTHVLATAGAGVTNTVDLGHGVNLVSQANASATTEAHVGPLGVGANVVLNAKVSETLNLTDHADITVAAKATGDVHAKASVITGVGGSADGGVNAEASFNQHEKGSLGGGVDGKQQTTLAAGLDAHGTGGANVGLNGVSGGFGAFAGAYAKVGETAGIEGGGVKASASVEVYSPGVVGVNQSGTFDVHDGKVNIAFSIGGAFGIGGLSIGGNISIDTHKLADAGNAIVDGIFGPSSHTIERHTRTPEQVKIEADFNNVLQAMTKYEQKLEHDMKSHDSFAKYKEAHMHDALVEVTGHKDFLKPHETTKHFAEHNPSLAHQAEQKLMAEWDKTHSPESQREQMAQIADKAWAQAEKQFDFKHVNEKFVKDDLAARPKWLDDPGNQHMGDYGYESHGWAKLDHGDIAAPTVR